MDNFLSHPDKVKYIDGLMAHSQEWQWFIDLLIVTFDVHEITSWSEYEATSQSARNVFEYFVKILQISKKNWSFSQNLFSEIWEIARYYIGIQTLDECATKIKSSFSQLFLFCIWLTKIENSCQENANYLYNTHILNQKNYFQLINLDPYLVNKEDLLAYAEKINVSGFDVPLQCLKDNLASKEYRVNDNFLNTIQDNILNYRTLSFQNISIDPYSTWQEIYLTNMLKVNIKEKELQPMVSFGNNIFPDFSLWEKDILYQMKEYFHHKCADFLIDTILYILHAVPLPEPTTRLHLEFLKKAVDTKEPPLQIYESSSYKIVSMLFEDKNLKNVSNQAWYRDFLISLQAISDIDLIIHLRNDHFPISETQKTLYNDFYRSKFKQIANINTINNFEEYLSDSDNSILIDSEHLFMVQAQFDAYITKYDSFEISILFYKYMLFLFSLNNKNQIVDKRWVYSEMIRVQKLWETNYYIQQIQNMQTISYTQKIQTEEVNKFNNLVLKNPIYFAQRCIPCKKEEIIEIMQVTSEHPMIHLASKLTLSPTFPSETKVSTERHEIDKMFSTQIENILDSNGYKFLNILSLDNYLEDIHQRYKENTFLMVSLFNREEDLYNLIQEKTEIELLPFSKHLTLGMTTQLFPILEMKIREFSTLFGIFPFKKDPDHFMQYTDPSSLLREILKIIYDEQRSFENVPDLLFVYNLMYNSNSLNIRNECIHGRSYLSGHSLKTAFIITLFSIFMIEFRIKTIKENVSDILELPE